MAQLNARTDSFITLLLDVSGRARPGDLTAMGPDEAAAVLQGYADAHPERGLAFDGESLVPAAAPVPTPVTQGQASDTATHEALGAPPVPDTSTVPAPPAWEDFSSGGIAQAPAESDWHVPGDASAIPAVSPYTAPSPVDPTYTTPVTENEMFTQPAGVPEHEMFIQPAAVPEHEMFSEAPAVFGEGATTAPDDALAATQGAVAIETPATEVEAGGADYGVPMAPGVGGYYGVADQPPPEYSDAAKAGEYQGDEVFATQEAAPSEYTPQPVGDRSVRMPWWWWVLAIIFYPVGGIVGYFVVRRTDPRGARNLLILTLVMFVLGILAAAAIFFFGLAALSALLPAGTAP